LRDKDPTWEREKGRGKLNKKNIPGGKKEEARERGEVDDLKGNVFTIQREGGEKE